MSGSGEILKTHISPTSVKGAPKIFIPLPLQGIRIVGNFKTIASPGSCGGDNYKKCIFWRVFNFANTVCIVQQKLVNVAIFTQRKWHICKFCMCDWIVFQNVAGVFVHAMYLLVEFERHWNQICRLLVVMTLLLFSGLIVRLHTYYDHNTTIYGSKWLLSLS